MKHKLEAVVVGIISGLIAALISYGISLAAADTAGASPRRALTTWYGPSLYGNPVACPGYGPLTRYTRGVAHRTLPCGTDLYLYRGVVKVRVEVIDRGPFTAATFDLSARTAQNLCRCVRPYTMYVYWERA